MSLAVAPPTTILMAGRIGDVSVSDLVARFGSPLYVYDVGVIDHQVAALRGALPSRADLAYALKANPSLAVVGHIGDLGLGADVASAGELATAQRAGIPADRIVMTGPGKRDDELAAAVEARIRAVTVESPSELARLEAIAARAGRRVPVLLRAATTGRAPDEIVRLIGDAGAGKFGMSDADLARAARRAVHSPHLEFLGLHAFGASNVRDATALVEHARSTAVLARDLASLVGTTVAIVDVGGGLGIPYADGETPLDTEALGRGLGELTDAWSHDPVMTGARLLLEPGRFLAGPAGIYVATVLDRKGPADGVATIILDGGIHHLLRPALVRHPHRVVAVNTAGRPVERVTVAGPLCTGLDVFARSIPLPRPEVGDLLAVLDVGAYGFTESMPLFLSHPTPAEVVVFDGHAALARPRIGAADWLDRQLRPRFSD